MMQFPQRPIVWMTASALLVLAAPALSAGEAAEPSAIADERLAGSSSIDLLSADGSTREQMAMGLLRALEVAGFDPPACVPGDEVFNDVPASSTFCPFIEELFRRGITSGCGGGNYCPSAAVSRAQMAVFLVRSIEAAQGLSAVVDGDGTLVRGRGVVSSELVGGAFVAVYRVVFDADVSGCATLGTVGVPVFGAVIGYLTTSHQASNPNSVIIRTFNQFGDPTERPFHLHIVC